jgi:hypothetical protein
MRSIARGLQVIGLTLPLVGIFLVEGTGDAAANAAGGLTMAYSFGSLILGAGIFYLGWTLQRRTEG